MINRALISRLAGALLIGLTATSHAAIITVNSLDDDVANDGNCTLREAIESANDNSTRGAPVGECQAGEDEPVIDEIVFDPAVIGTIAISSELPAIFEDVFINGPGADVLAIEGNALSSGGLSIVRIIDGSQGSTIAGLTFQNLVTNDSTAVLQVSSPLTLRDCAFKDNSASGSGVILVLNSLTVERCSFWRNTNMNGGGAIRFTQPGDTLIIRDSYFVANAALDNHDGGAVEAIGSGLQTLISGTTFVGNRASRDGGAISIGGASLLLENSTLHDNKTDRDGGAIKFVSLTSQVANITVSDNLADSDDDGNGSGGGIMQLGSRIPNIRNSLIAGNATGKADSNNETPDCSGTFISDGFNLIGDVGTGCTGFANGVNGDQVGTSTNPIDPFLEPLADNGGPTPTMHLQGNSPAVAGGNPDGCEAADGSPLTLDQRGNPRPWPRFSVCDIGAVERGFVQQFSLTINVSGSGGGRVTSFPSGINCPSSDCKADFSQDTVVVLTAQAATGVVFDGWTGDCTGTGTCQVTMTAPASVGAKFTAIEDAIFSSSFEN